MTIQEIEQELFEMERKLKSMFNACSQDLAIGIEKLRGELAELKESKKEGKWKPKVGETYWFRDVRGAIVSDKFEPDCWSSYWRVKNIPIFETREECERYWHFMDIVKEKSYEFSKEVWENGEIEKWRIIYDGEAKGFCVEANYLICVFNATYFKSREDAQYIIDNFKEELLKYWI